MRTINCIEQLILSLGGFKSFGLNSCFGIPKERRTRRKNFLKGKQDYPNFPITLHAGVAFVSNIRDFFPQFYFQSLLPEDIGG